jgi:hypothetical protein
MYPLFKDFLSSNPAFLTDKNDELTAFLYAGAAQKLLEIDNMEDYRRVLENVSHPQTSDELDELSKLVKLLERFY